MNSTLNYLYIILDSQINGNSYQLITQANSEKPKFYSEKWLWYTYHIVEMINPIFYDDVCASKC